MAQISTFAPGSPSRQASAPRGRLLRRDLTEGSRSKHPVPGVTLSGSRSQLFAVENAPAGAVSAFQVIGTRVVAAFTVRGGIVDDAGEGIAHSPDGSLVAVTDGDEDRVAIYARSLDAERGTRFDLVVELDTGRAPAGAAFSPCGSLLATVNTADGTLSAYAISGSGSTVSVTALGAIAAAPTTGVVLNQS